MVPDATASVALFLADFDSFRPRRFFEGDFLALEGVFGDGLACLAFVDAFRFGLSGESNLLDLEGVFGEEMGRSSLAFEDAASVFLKDDFRDGFFGESDFFGLCGS